MTTPPAHRNLGARFESARARLLLAAAALAVAAAIIVPLATRGSSSSSSVSPIAPVALSATGLSTLARNVPQPIYWAGPKSGLLYELTRTKVGNVYIRYLPKGVQAGAPGSNYLVVVTYPYPNAYHALQAVANGKQVSIPGGGIAVVDSADTKSVHVAYPGVNYQVEVYDPSPSTARSVATSGTVRPVSG